MRIIFSMNHTFPLPIRKFGKREVLIGVGIINVYSNSRVDRFPASYSGGSRFKSRPRN
jgi:hypothetical protein